MNKRKSIGERREIRWKKITDKRKLITKGTVMNTNEFKSGDKVLLDCGTEISSTESQRLNKTIVTLRHMNHSRTGWYIRESKFWFRTNKLRSITNPCVEVAKSKVEKSHAYCNCNSSNVVENYAGGKKFFYCRSCKKERL